MKNGRSCKSWLRNSKCCRATKEQKRKGKGGEGGGGNKRGKEGRKKKNNAGMAGTHNPQSFFGLYHYQSMAR